MGRAISDSVTWVGKTDWELRRFHGEEYSTHRGSTYNAYLVRDEKTALIDTVWTPFADEFVENLAHEIDPARIDYIVANHAETDHSGALARLMERIPDTPVYCTKNGVDSLKGHFHRDWNFHPVKTGDTLSLGGKELVFIKAPMLHWPDSMFCYLTGENILFSNDAFGQHLATERLYNDLVDPCELQQECIKYYANILTPFSSLVDKKTQEVLDLGLPVRMICPSHGVIWRDDPLQIVTRYREWANAHAEDRIAIVYDTMWEGTRRMAEAIAGGISEADPGVRVTLANIARSDKNDVVTDVFASRALLAGSPTINRRILSAMGGFLEEIRGLGFKGKKVCAFGCYGWSGEGVGILSEALARCGFEVAAEGIREQWSPDRAALERCREYGRGAAEKLR